MYNVHMKCKKLMRLVCLTHPLIRSDGANQTGESREVNKVEDEIVEEFDDWSLKEMTHATFKT